MLLSKAIARQFTLPTIRRHKNALINGLRKLKAQIPELLFRHGFSIGADMNEEIEAAIAARKAEFWAAVDDTTPGERTNGNLQQLEGILQDLRDSF